MSRAMILEKIEALTDQLEGMDIDDKYQDEAVDLLSQGIKVNPLSSYEKLYVLMLRLQVFLDKMKVDLDYIDVDGLQALVRKRKLTYKELTRMYLDRISLYNNHTIKINAIRAINPKALEEAEARDKEVQQYPEKVQGLFGMPILVKDNIGTSKDLGLPTTACSVALANNYVEEDAFVISQLRKQGVVILAKTNLSELANFFTFGVKRANGELEKMPAGYSTLAGQVLSPYDPLHISPAGSSSGSGAGCAAGLGALALGTETTGSILFPAHANSLVGIKPTLGLISRRGIIPLSHSQDTAGTLTRSVKDAAYLLRGMVGFDDKDYQVTTGSDNLPATKELINSKLEDYVEALTADGLQGKRLGIYADPEPALKPFFTKLIEKLKTLGAEIFYDEDQLPMEVILEKYKRADDATANASELLQLDFAYDINNYLAQLKNNNISLTGSEIKNLKDIVEYNRHYPERLKYGQSILEKCLEFDITPGSKDMERAKLIHDQEITRARTLVIDALFEKYKLDALIALDRGTTRIGAIAGYPTISVPVGYKEKEYYQHPINLAFTGKAFTEGKLISMAYALEQALKARRAPGMAVRDSLYLLLQEARFWGLQGREVERAEAVAGDNFASQPMVDKAEAALSAALATMD